MQQSDTLHVGCGVLLSELAEFNAHEVVMRGHKAVCVKLQLQEFQFTVASAGGCNLT